MDGDDAALGSQLRQQNRFRHRQGAKNNLPAAITAGIGSH